MSTYFNPVGKIKQDLSELYSIKRSECNCFKRLLKVPLLLGSIQLKRVVSLIELGYSDDSKTKTLSRFFKFGLRIR